MARLHGNGRAAGVNRQFLAVSAESRRDLHAVGGSPRQLRFRPDLDERGRPRRVSPLWKWHRLDQDRAVNGGRTALRFAASFQDNGLIGLGGDADAARCAAEIGHGVGGEESAHAGHLKVGRIADREHRRPEWRLAAGRERDLAVRQFRLLDTAEYDGVLGLFREIGEHGVEPRVGSRSTRRAWERGSSRYRAGARSCGRVRGRDGRLPGSPSGGRRGVHRGRGARRCRASSPPLRDRRIRRCRVAGRGRESRPVSAARLGPRDQEQDGEKSQSEHGHSSNANSSLPQTQQPGQAPRREKVTSRSLAPRVTRRSIWELSFSLCRRLAERVAYR